MKERESRMPFPVFQAPDAGSAVPRRGGSVGFGGRQGVEGFASLRRQRLGHCLPDFGRAFQIGLCFGKLILAGLGDSQRGQLPGGFGMPRPEDLFEERNSACVKRLDRRGIEPDKVGEPEERIIIMFEHQRGHIGARCHAFFGGFEGAPEIRLCLRPATPACEVTA